MDDIERVRRRSGIITNDARTNIHQLCHLRRISGRRNIRLSVGIDGNSAALVSVIIFRLEISIQEQGQLHRQDDVKELEAVHCGIDICGGIAYDELRQFP